MPPPPPPPGPPPPPIMTPAASGSSSSGPPRDMLLQSIRQGTKLKKTVTVDKSGPCLAGKVTSGSGVESSREGSSPRTNGGPPALGGLFSNGMPKLRPTGLAIAAASPPKNGPIRPTNPNVNRGPPPQPPPANLKPSFASSASESSVNSQPSNNGFTARPLLPNKPPVTSFGKPNFAPRPPPPAAPNASALHGGSQEKPSPPPKKLTINGRPMVSRAQSMRAPRSPPVAAPNANGPLVSHLSQEGLNISKTGTLPHNFHHGLKIAPSPPNSVHRATPTRPPGTRPPPPPSRPAPPTSAPPPPPPHRTSPAPPPPRMPSAAPNLAPPAPPARNSSMRNGSTASLMSELEARLPFHNIREFPEPQPFRNVVKQYSSRTPANAGIYEDDDGFGWDKHTKQQAPPPPPPQTATHVQLSQKMWSSNASQC